MEVIGIIFILCALSIILVGTLLMFVTSANHFGGWLLKGFGENGVIQWLVKQGEKRRREIENQAIAQRAMKRARAEPEEFTLTDVGLLAYRDRSTSRIVRSTPVVTDTRYLRPFAEISARQRTRAQVTMALLDSNGQPMFVDKNTYVLHRKPTHLVTKTWLPLENLAHTGGNWSIVIDVNDTPLAIHRFGWVGLADNEIVEHLGNDGELSPELREAVKTGKFRRMSLDELLSDQEE